MTGQDYDKDLFIVLVGSGTTTLKNFVDNVEDYIFGPKDEREAELLVPYTDKMTSSLGMVLNEWAVGEDDEPNYPIHAFVQGEHGHKSVAKSKQVVNITEPHGVAMESAAVEAAMEALLTEQANGGEVVVVVLYDEEKDIDLVGSLKNYNSIPVVNLDGMIDSFPGFRTTDEILQEEREREAFEAEEAIRIAAEKEVEKAEKLAKKAAASPRKRATAKPASTDVPLTDADVETPAPPAKKAAAPRKRVAKPPVVEAKVEEPSELPKELEPVRDITREKASELISAGVLVPEDLPSAEERPDLWTDVSKAKAEVDRSNVTHYAVSKENLASLSEGITEMAQSFSKVMASMTKIIEGE